MSIPPPSFSQSQTFRQQQFGSTFRGTTSNTSANTGLAAQEYGQSMDPEWGIPDAPGFASAAFNTGTINNLGNSFSTFQGFGLPGMMTQQLPNVEEVNTWNSTRVSQWLDECGLGNLIGID